MGRSLQLSAEPPNHIQQDRQQHAQNNGGRQRKIESCVLSAVKDVARQTPKGEAGLAKEEKQQPNRHQGHPEKHQNLTEFGHGFSLEQLAKLNLASASTMAHGRKRHDFTVHFRTAKSENGHYGLV